MGQSVEATRSPWGIAAGLLRADMPHRMLFESPAALMQALNPELILTPALLEIDAALVQIGRAVTVMERRRQALAEGLADGLEHPDALAYAVEMVPDDGWRRLLISMPPQEGKSTIVSHYGMLWLLLEHPWIHLGIVSYAKDIARRMTAMLRSDIETWNGSDGGVDLRVRLDPASRAADRFSLAWPDIGDVYGVGVGGQLTSRPLDVLDIDDPVKDYRDADSVVKSESSAEWYEAVARTRLAPWAPVLITATRWSQKDMIGRLLAKQAELDAQGTEGHDRWHVINIPAQADHDPERGQVDLLGREPGQYMVSARGRTTADWEATKMATRPRLWQALFQGRPSSEAGDVFNREWWHRYGENGVPVPWTCDTEAKVFTVLNPRAQIIQSWDCAFKDRKDNDYVCGGVWCKIGPNVYLLDVVVAHLSFTKTLAAILLLRQKWPQGKTILIEEKANGAAVLDYLRQRVGGVVAEIPKESKEARADAVSPFVEAGNVWLPTTDHRVAQFDVEGFIEECAAFPHAVHDDQVDMMTQALKRLLLKPGQGAMFSEAWKREREKSGRPHAVDVGEMEVDDDADEVLAELQAFSSIAANELDRSSPDPRRHRRHRSCRKHFYFDHQCVHCGDRDDKERHG